MASRSVKAWNELLKDLKRRKDREGGTRRWLRLEEKEKERERERERGGGGEERRGERETESVRERGGGGAKKRHKEESCRATS